MTSQTVSIPWGKEQLTFHLPEHWELAGMMEPAPLPGVSDPAAEAKRSLQTPTGSQRLSELAKAGMKITLVVDDDSRPTPVQKIMPAVAAELLDGGATLDQVTVVPALGVHRAMTEEELSRRVGAEWLSQMRWEMHNSSDPEKMVQLGVTSRGSPVTVNRTVAQADLVISIGCIEPHIIASFGGGYKNLFPGTAGKEMIAHNHRLNCQPETFNNVGQPIENNPMRLDLEEAGRMIPGKVFIINAVLNSGLEVVEIVCGDPVAAHRAGAQVSAGIYGAKVPGAAEVVITGSHPMDQDLRQGVKALANTVRAVRPGGVMITCVRADEGVGVFGLANRKLPVGRRTLKLLAPMLLPMLSKIKLQGMGEEDFFFLYFAMQVMVRCDALLYAPTIPTAIHKNLPFITFMESPEAALARAEKRFPGMARVLIFPHGGCTYPILPK